MTIDYYLCDRRTKKMFGLGHAAFPVADALVKAPNMPVSMLAARIFEWWYTPSASETPASASLLRADAAQYSNWLAQQLRTFLGSAGPGDTFFVSNVDGLSEVMQAGYVLAATRYTNEEEPNDEG